MAIPLTVGLKNQELKKNNTSKSVKWDKFKPDAGYFRQMRRKSINVEKLLGYLQIMMHVVLLFPTLIKVNGLVSPHSFSECDNQSHRKWLVISYRLSERNYFLSIANKKNFATLRWNFGHRFRPWFRRSLAWSPFIWEVLYSKKSLVFTTN